MLRRVQSTSRVAVVRRGSTARLWTRNRNDISDRFPDIVAAAEKQLPDGSVLDGELVILGADGRLSFDALQQRLVTSPAKARAKAAQLPAAYAAFDLLAIGGVDLRTQRWTARRQRLEQLAAGWAPPLQLTPVTSDVDDARQWFEVLPAAMGVEGLVVKGAATRYTPGRRDAWVKVKHRETREVIVGGVIGPIDRPEVVIAGRYRAGELVMVGRTVPLSVADSHQLGAVLRPATRGHPWPDEIASVLWGGKDSKKPLTKVRPDVVVEVLADAAMQAGQWRHGLRYVRYRADMQPDDVPTLSEPSEAG
ncbi:ATP dependent DNA ligase-like protein [Kribbella steppae]|uniref:ATP dependent DNA ligase-like protein n=1 Tax=Kribbella steppae TaxID=2512223 RepID=A0A4R2HRE1_9ACTN|nr:ATP-dependent DNA ligase [Kribbella steppae]TCO33048.1 ATP dependent DNA ligase-like protein [Kribbella steppae]